VGVWKPKAGLRFADVLVIEQKPLPGQPPRVETFSFKSRDLSRLGDDALKAQMKADASEALGYYGETLDIRRPSLKQLVREGSEVPVQRVRLIYEGGKLKPEKVNVLKAAVEEAEHAVKGVEVLFQ
jgi:CBS-domain-containing membrane protein